MAGPVLDTGLRRRDRVVLGLVGATLVAVSAVFAAADLIGSQTGGAPPGVAITSIKDVGRVRDSLLVRVAATVTNRSDHRLTRLTFRATQAGAGLGFQLPDQDGDTYVRTQAGVNVNIAPGKTGSAQMTIEVPAARAGDAAALQVQGFGFQEVGTWYTPWSPSAAVPPAAQFHL